jgi:hypothetical protein
LENGLPPNGSEDEEEAPIFGTTIGSPILSDLRTPLWHAVDSSTLADPWWIQSLIAAGAGWEYRGRGGVSAAELDRDRNIGWSSWWKKEKLETVAGLKDRAPIAEALPPRM